MAATPYPQHLPARYPEADHHDDNHQYGGTLLPLAQQTALSIAIASIRASTRTSVSRPRRVLSPILGAREPRDQSLNDGRKLTSGQ